MKYIISAFSLLAIIAIARADAQTAPRVLPNGVFLKSAVAEDNGEKRCDFTDGVSFEVPGSEPCFITAPPPTNVTAVLRSAPQQSSSLQSVVGSRDSCISTAHSDPRMTSIAKHFPAFATDLTLAQLTDAAALGKKDVPLVSTYDEMVKACNAPMLSALKTQAPAIAIAIENETAQRQDAWVSLIQKKLNWGGFNQQTKAIAAQVKSEIDSAIQAAQAQQDAERRAQEQVAQQRADQQQFAQRQQVMDGGTCQLVAQSVPPQGGGTCALCGVLNVLSTTIARNNAYRSCMQAHGWTVQ